MSVPVKRRLQRIAATFNSKARKLHVPGVVSWQMLAHLPGHCAYCGTELRLEDGTWDHVVPFDNGGANHLSNITRCCTTCQRAKFTKSPAQYDSHRELVVICARPGCGNTYQPRWAEYQAGRARFCSHQCAGAAKGKGW